MSDSAELHPVARTRDEANLYLDLHPCACGSAETDWESGLVSLDDDDLATCYQGTCRQCGAFRRHLFALPERETMPTGFPTFGGNEPSRLLDAGEWLWVADVIAGNVPVGEEQENLSIARAAVEEVVKFIPPGQDEVPPEAFWSERGQAMREAEPGRFQLDRLLIVRDTYRNIAAEARKDSS